jgi:beta-RFAP synthase
MIRIQAPSRLHFGLFSLAAGEPRRNLDDEPSLPTRRFGGVGLMIEEPALVLLAEPAETWSASGPVAKRVLEFVKQCSRRETKPMRFTVQQAPPEHAGFGAGTQLALAVAKALAIHSELAESNAESLAARAGRGLRSAIGVHGFDRGGLIVEAGKLGDEAVAPLLIHEKIPDAWRIVLIKTGAEPALHGDAERAAFEKLPTKPELTDVLCRLVLLGMLPALRAGDCRAFGEALYDFNARVGEAFAPVQGGRYCNAAVAEIIRFIRSTNVAGVGQSSWGPAVFAIVEDEARAANMNAAIQRRFGKGITTWTTKSSHGHEASRCPPPSSSSPDSS